MSETAQTSSASSTQRNKKNFRDRQQRSPIKLPNEYPAIVPEVPQRPEVEDIKRLHEAQFKKIKEIEAELSATEAKIEEMKTKNDRKEQSEISEAIRKLYDQKNALVEKNRTNIEIARKANETIKNLRETLGKDCNRSATEINNEMGELIELIEHHCSGKNGKEDEQYYQVRLNKLRKTVLPGVMQYATAKKEHDTANSELKEYKVLVDSYNKQIDDLKKKREVLNSSITKTDAMWAQIKQKRSDLYQRRNAIYDSIKSSSKAFDEAKERYNKLSREKARILRIQEAFRAAWAPHLKALAGYEVSVVEQKGKCGKFDVTNWKKTIENLTTKSYNTISVTKNDNDTSEEGSTLAQKVNQGLYTRREIIDWCERALKNEKFGATSIEKRGKKEVTIIDYEILGWLSSEGIDKSRIETKEGVQGVLDEVKSSMNAKVQIKIDEINKSIRVHLKELRLKHAILNIQGEDESIMNELIEEPKSEKVVNKNAEDVEAKPEDAEVQEEVAVVSE